VPKKTLVSGRKKRPREYGAEHTTLELTTNFGSYAIFAELMKKCPQEGLNSFNGRAIDDSTLRKKRIHASTPNNDCL